jgi:putative transposase
MSAEYPLTVLCAVLAVWRSGYHAWAAGRRDRRTQRDHALREAIQTAFAASRRTYGYPRLTVQLRAQGERVGKARVARLRRESALQGRTPRRYKPKTTQSDHDGPIAPNRLAHAPPLTACDQVWQTDITYLATAAGWLYLAVVLDAYSKRILGWAFSASLQSEFVVAALRMARAPRRPLAPGTFAAPRPRRAVHQRALPRSTRRQWPDRFDEPPRQLLRQRTRRSLFLHAQTGARLP